MRIEEIKAHYDSRIMHYHTMGYNTAERKDCALAGYVPACGMLLYTEMENSAGKRVYLSLSTMCSDFSALVPPDMRWDYASLVYIEASFPNSFIPEIIDCDVFYEISKSRGARWYVTIPEMRQIKKIREERASMDRWKPRIHIFSTDKAAELAIKTVRKDEKLSGISFWRDRTFREVRIRQVLFEILSDRWEKTYYLDRRCEVCGGLGQTVQTCQNENNYAVQSG